MTYSLKKGSSQINKIHKKIKKALNKKKKIESPSKPKAYKILDSVNPTGYEIKC